MKTSALTKKSLPSHNSRFVRQASEIIGGPVGKYALIGGQRFFSPWSLTLLATLIVSACSWLLRTPCIQQSVDPSTGNLRLNWLDNRQYWSLCYTNLLASPPDSAAWAFSSHNHSSFFMGIIFYLLFLFSKTLANFLTRFGLDPILPEIIYFNLQSLLLTWAWVTVVFLVFRLTKSNSWWAIWVGISPLLLFQQLSDYRVYTVLGLVSCYYFWLQKQYVVAGILGGLTIVDFPLSMGIILFLSVIDNPKVGKFIYAWLLSLGGVVLLGSLGGGVSWLWVVIEKLVPKLEIDSIYTALVGLFSSNPNYWNPPTITNWLRLGELLLLCLWTVIIIIFNKSTSHKVNSSAGIFWLLVGYSLLSFSWPLANYLLLIPFLILSVANLELNLVWMSWVALLWLPKMFSQVDSYNKGLPTQWYFAAYLLNGVFLLAILIYQLTKFLREDHVK